MLGCQEAGHDVHEQIFLQEAHRQMLHDMTALCRVCMRINPSKGLQALETVMSSTATTSPVHGQWAPLCGQLSCAAKPGWQTLFSQSSSQT